MQRLAIDLLLARSESFLVGAAPALKASFRDIKRHLIASFAGLHGQLVMAIATFDPATLDAAAARRASFLKGALPPMSRKRPRGMPTLPGRLMAVRADPSTGPSSPPTTVLEAEIGRESRA